MKAVELVAESTIATSLCFKYVVFRRGGEKMESVMKIKDV